jgi:hypothetical protein
LVTAAKGGHDAIMRLCYDVWDAPMLVVLWPRLRKEATKPSCSCVTTIGVPPPLIGLWPRLRKEATKPSCDCAMTNGAPPTLIGLWPGL